jgi:hypothetical protein
MAGFSDLANCLAIVALGIVTAVQWRRGLQGFEDLNYLGLLRVDRRSIERSQSQDSRYTALKKTWIFRFSVQGDGGDRKTMHGATPCEAAINVQ